jgi:hypothetical protein
MINAKNYTGTTTIFSYLKPLGLGVYASGTLYLNKPAV